MYTDQLIVSVIIPTYKDWETLKNCVAALEEQSFPANQFEVIIVNNDPAGETPAGFHLPHNFKMIGESKPGSYAARNTGLKIAKGSIIGFTDSDCTPDKDWIKNGVEFLKNNTKYSRVAGPVEILQKSASPTIIERYNQLYSFPQRWLVDNGGGSVTANLFVHKYVFEKVGGFDEKLMSMGDKHWGIKAQKAGYPIAYVANVVVHHPPRNFAELVKKEKRHGGAVVVKEQIDNPVKLYLKFFYEFRPRMSGVKYMFGRNLRKDGRRIKDRFAIPFLRHYLLLVRAYEALKVRLGKEPNRV